MRTNNVLVDKQEEELIETKDSIGLLLSATHCGQSQGDDGVELGMFLSCDGVFEDRSKRLV